MQTIAAAVQQATALQLWGAAGFGALIGWFAYYVNRYRTGEVQLGDLVTLVGVIGGGAVLALFPAGSDLFGAYGIGLFSGFFGYFVVLIILVAMSKNFQVDFFLDGRRKAPESPYEIPRVQPGEGRPPMSRRGGGDINT